MREVITNAVIYLFGIVICILAVVVSPISTFAYTPDIYSSRFQILWFLSLGMLCLYILDIFIHLYDLHKCNTYKSKFLSGAVFTVLLFLPNILEILIDLDSHTLLCIFQMRQLGIIFYISTYST